MPGGARRAVTALIFSAAVAAIVACAPQPPPLGAPRATISSVSPPLVKEVVLGVDRLTSGFNPHTLADLTPVSEAVAGLLLPSAFHQAPAGQWVVDHTLLTSAEVTSTAPFTVTYRIRRNAQWSDSTPIGADDFEYLAAQMRSQPGVVDSAGYQLIDQVISRDGGKTVEVVFNRPYAGWRTLFRHLLPAHLLKDAPGGWSKALDAGVPVSGGPFALTSVDRSRGEIVLERNDRYWDAPTQVGRIRLRQGSEAALIEALRTGGVQGALFGRPNAITVSLLRSANLGVSPTVVPQPVLVSVLLRPASRVLSDQRMRTAVAAVLDRASLIATGVGSGPSAALRADSAVLAPSAPDYHPTAPVAGVPVAPDPDATRRLLTDAGYTRGPAGWQRAGQPLRLVVAAPANREPYGTLAARVVDQLRTAGIDAELREVDADELFGTLLGPSSDAGVAVSPRGATAQTFPASVATPDVDIVVLPQPAAGHPATELESWYGCPLVVPARLAPAPPNPAQFCDLTLQPMIEQALTQDDPAGPVPATLEAALWERAVTIPLYQPASLLITTTALPDVAPGTPLEGPLDGAARWQLRS
ncbi:MAG TPA: ABC transporter family substrate-binding protein [Pseudonocardiaceae bacterium]|jgi:ABC-type transport system substrate-binding protein|nr:ABC transporter family substrate-binding protein [Pseudonocardiaceae bacterium]